MQLVAGARRPKAADLICCGFLQGRRCVSHAELAAARGRQAVVVPIPRRTHDPAGDGPATATAAGAAAAAGSESPKALESAAAAAAAAAADGVREYAEQLVVQLCSAGLPALLDASPSAAPGAKFHAWERRGVPLRLEVGQAEVTSGTVTVALNPGLVPQLLVELSAAATGGDSSSSSSSSSSREVLSLLQLYAHGWQQQAEQLQQRAAAATANREQATSTVVSPHPAAACCGGVGISLWGGNAVAAAGVAPLKLAGVPAAMAAAVCKQLLQAAAARAADAYVSGAAIATSKPGATPAATASLFVSGLPTARPAAAVRQQLLQQLSGRGVVGAAVPGVGQGRRCRGWARLLADEAAAAALLGQLAGGLQLQPGAPPAVLSRCCGRADALFPALPFHCRRRLRLDPVAAYSTTDGPTAAAMAALLAALAAELRQQPDQQQPDAGSGQGKREAADSGSSSSSCSAPGAVVASGSPATAAAAEAALSKQGSLTPGSLLQLSVADLTACAGGNAIAFAAAGCFAAVTALELDPDRAEDLAHNLHLALQQQQQQSSPCSGARPSSVPAGADELPPLLAFDPAVVPYMAVLHPQQQQQQQQQSYTSSPGHQPMEQRQQPGIQQHVVGVVCGDAVQLLPQLQQQDVIFIDPPWGGPNYNQRQQQQQQQPEHDVVDTDSDEDATSGSHVVLQPVVPLQQETVHAPRAPDKPAADGTAGGAVSSVRVAAAAAALQLGGLALLEFCIQLAGRCRLLAVKLPSRCADLDKFSQAVLAGMHLQHQQQLVTGADKVPGSQQQMQDSYNADKALGQPPPPPPQQQQQQQQQQQDAKDQHSAGSDASQQQQHSSLMLAVRAHFGRTDLLLFMQQQHSGQRLQQQQQQQLHKRLRQCLNAHQQQHASVLFPPTGLQL
ncbi:hypothetical protein COO60DRAFT_1646460 [Scenedesmus sp. NREL 46B-D3]|nr:hypothetical protein COO60DRAFT_1646460 [Scenedesmus sp. NREL 46B-D3]